MPEQGAGDIELAELVAEQPSLTRTPVEAVPLLLESGLSTAVELHIPPIDSPMDLATSDTTRKFFTDVL